jgi:hypothetical protein
MKAAGNRMDGWGSFRRGIMQCGILAMAGNGGGNVDVDGYCESLRVIHVTRAKHVELDVHGQHCIALLHCREKY